MIPPRVLDQLYAAPLGQFTATRDALAAGLEREGETQAATALRAQKKPSAAIWALNQLARQDRVALEHLLRQAERLRSLQLGNGEPGETRAASADYRGRLRALAEQSAAILRAAGQRPSGAMVDRITGTLQTALAGEQTRAALRDGRLAQELEPVGFGAFTGAVPEELSPAPSGHPRGKVASLDEARERQRVAKRASARTADRERATEERRRRALAERERQAVERRQAAEEREREAVERRQQIEAAERRLLEARRRARQIELDLSKARGEVEVASRELARARGRPPRRTV